MKARYSQLTKEILLYLATTGAIILALTSPYLAIQIARKILGEKQFLSKQIGGWKIARAIQRLRRNKVIIMKEDQAGGLTVELTENGKRKVKEIQLEKLTLKKSQFWDGKWRIVIFDIPEKRNKRGRDALRERLRQLNFYRLQKSVWVTPWPCENEILFLAELFEITPFVNILEVDRIYNDVNLRKYFHLL